MMQCLQLYPSNYIYSSYQDNESYLKMQVKIHFNSISTLLNVQYSYVVEECDATKV
jgi:hypothetical protein